MAVFPGAKITPSAKDFAPDVSGKKEDVPEIFGKGGTQLSNRPLKGLSQLGDCNSRQRTEKLGP